MQNKNKILFNNILKSLKNFVKIFENFYLSIFLRTKNLIKNYCCKYIII